MADIQAGHPREHQVQHHDVRPEGPHPAETVLPVLHGGDLMSLAAQGECDCLPHGVVVLDQQYAWHAVSIRTAVDHQRRCYGMII